MGQKSTKINTISVLGYGFIIDTKYNIHIYESVKDYVRYYNKTKGTNFMCHSSEYPYLDNNSPDKIFISYDKIRSYNQEIVEGHCHLTSKNISIDIDNEQIKHLTNIGNYLVDTGSIPNFKLGWNLFEVMI